MPDQYGRYSLLEMRQYVLRNLTVLRAASVDSITGAEVLPLSLGLNAIFSKEVLNLRLNSSLAKVTSEANLENERIFASEVFYDAMPGVFQYQLPPDMVSIRGLWWKDASIVAPANPSQYVPMSMQDEFANPGEGIVVQLGRPTWRLVGQYVQLNEDPGDFGGLNVEGIWFRYTRYVQYLVDDNQVIDLPFARTMQEVVIWDATLACVRTQDEIVDSKGVTDALAEWWNQLETVIRNEYKPPNMLLRGPAMVKNTFIGR